MGFPLAAEAGQSVGQPKGVGGQCPQGKPLTKGLWEPKEKFLFLSCSSGGSPENSPGRLGSRQQGQPGSAPAQWLSPPPFLGFCRDKLVLMRPLEQSQVEPLQVEGPASLLSLSLQQRLHRRGLLLEQGRPDVQVPVFPPKFH